MGLGEDLYNKNKPISSSEFLDDVRAIAGAIKIMDPTVFLYMFGSVATNSATTYSDLDIAVVCENYEKKESLKKLFYSKKRMTTCSLDIVFLSQSQYENDIENPIAQVIKTEGIQLYPDWKWNHG
jgi:predicted nucleotidyltransferase